MRHTDLIIFDPYKTSFSKCLLPVAYFGYLLSIAEVLRVSFNSIHISLNDEFVAYAFPRSPLIDGSYEFVILPQHHELAYIRFFILSLLGEAFRFTGYDRSVIDFAYQTHDTSSLLVIDCCPCGDDDCVLNLSVTGETFCDIYKLTLDIIIDNLKHTFECVYSIPISKGIIALDSASKSVTLRYYQGCDVDTLKSYISYIIADIYIRMLRLANDQKVDVFFIRNLPWITSFVSDYVFSTIITKEVVMQLLKDDRFSEFRIDGE